MRKGRGQGVGERVEDEKERGEGEERKARRREGRDHRAGLESHPREGGRKSTGAAFPAKHSDWR